MSSKQRGQRAETALRGILQARGYPCIRSAASKCLDVVCLRPSPLPSWGFEVKSVAKNHCRLDLRRHNVEQWGDMQAMYEDGFLVRYVVFWHSGEYWEVFHPNKGPIFRQGEGTDLGDFLLAAFPQHSPYSPPSDDTRIADYRDTGDAGSD